MWMNQWEIEDLHGGIDPKETPNLARLTEVLYQLMLWTNENSDGWPYWSKPSRAAEKIMQRLESHRRAPFDYDDTEDATAAEVTAALRPVKAFLTRQSVSADDRATILSEPKKVRSVRDMSPMEQGRYDFLTHAIAWRKSQIESHQRILDELEPELAALLQPKGA